MKKQNEMRMTTLCSCCVIFTITVFAAAQAQADVSIDVTGTPGSDIISVTMSGSGIWQGNKPAGYIGGNFDFVSFETPPPKSPPFVPTPAPLLTGSFSLSVSPKLPAIPLNELFIADGPPSFDFFGISPGVAFNSVAGLPYSVSGSGTFSLSTLGLNGKFDDLTPGTYTTTDFSGTGVGTVESIQLTIHPASAAAVPEPSSLFVIGLVGATCCVRRRRR